MIPQTLDEFRKLLTAAAEVCDMNGYPDHLIAPDLHALATATPAQLLGIVGIVAPEVVVRPDFTGETGRYMIIPLEGA